MASGERSFSITCLGDGGTTVSTPVIVRFRAQPVSTGGSSRGLRSYVSILNLEQDNEETIERFCIVLLGAYLQRYP
jgi:hypothetical protein